MAEPPPAKCSTATWPESPCNVQNVVYWLTPTSRLQAAKRFAVRDYEASEQANETVVSELTERMRFHLDDPDIIDDAIAALGAEEARKFFADATPSLRRVRRGHFGELLAVEMKVLIDQYHLPVIKLRFAIGNGTLHGIDGVVLQVDDSGEVREMHFIESKFRSTSYKDIAVDAEAQLRADMAAKYPAIIKFIITEMRKSNHPLYAAVWRYLSQFRDPGAENTFSISLCVEKATWRENALAELDTRPPKVLSPLEVSVFRIPSLTDLVDEIFKRVPQIEVVDVDD